LAFSLIIFESGRELVDLIASYLIDPRIPQVLLAVEGGFSY